jgi:hypothetical protein
LRKRYKEIFKTVEEYGAINSLDRLLDCAGVDGDELLRRLRNIHAYDPRRELRKYSTREAQVASQNIQDTADLIERLNQRGDSAALDGESRHLTHALPELLRNYAGRVKRLPHYVQERWEPKKVALVSQLVWYVAEATGTYHDEEVSALVGALLISRRGRPLGEWSATALKQWRTRHEIDIEMLGPLFVLPHIPRPSKTYKTRSSKTRST